MTRDHDRDAAYRESERALHESGRARDTPFARLYGAHLWHLLVNLALAAATAYAASLLLDDPALWRIAIWFVGAAVVWDMLLGPLYAGADAGLRAVLGRVRTRGVRPLNYVRVPAALSSLLLLVWAPLILQRSEQVYAVKTGLTQDPYLGRWLGLTAALFLLSGLAFAVAALRARR